MWRSTKTLCNLTKNTYYKIVTFIHPLLLVLKYTRTFWRDSLPLFPTCLWGKKKKKRSLHRSGLRLIVTYNQIANDSKHWLQIPSTFKSEMWCHDTKCIEFKDDC